MSLLDAILIVFAGAGLLHGVFGAYFLLRIRKRKSVAHRILALLLLAMAYRIGKSIALYFLADLEIPVVFTGLAAMAAIGPLLIGYFQAISKADFQFKTSHLLHFVPFGLMLVLSPFVTEEWFLRNGVYWMHLTLGVLYAQFAFYLVWAWRYVSVLNRGVGTKGKASRFLGTNWMKSVLLGLSALWFTYVSNLFFREGIPYIAGPIVYSAVIYILTVRFIRTKAYDLEPEDFADHPEETARFERLIHLLKEGQYFLQPELSLDDMAQKSNLSRHELSALINQNSGQNFNDFINHFRVQHAKMVLSDTRRAHLTISSIAFDSGFNSLSSFNSAFRKFERQTPSAYRSAQGK